ncbi:28S ribosomal protein S31, mitochondrial [Solea senegalensis]|uniref:Small ribosomal subunit protein mS31 n=1 Tax=Solea senegalensis TaxID=28829 RepID=A0AAV6SCI6_SOLSE|nr:28S ribosomal protein S31, mitochondrial [Solea senegalensis]KAG7515118.1 28S ribosomal protein S31, mitochondrial [Solea senegalensis]
MYRSLFRIVHTARSPSVILYESVKCDKAAVFRFANGGVGKLLSTSSVQLCEKKDDVVPSGLGEKTNADVKSELTESPDLAAQKVVDEGVVFTVAEQKQDPVELKTEDGSTTLHQTDVEPEQNMAKPLKEKTDAPKSGKESLLDLLGAMKVEVTNKRKLKTLQAQQIFESTTKSKPADMESATSMFQKAAEQNVSSQSASLDPELVSAASAAAATLLNSTQAESELLKQLRQHEAITEAQKKGDINSLGVIIADMKVGKNTKRQNTQPANQIQFDEDGRGYKDRAETEVASRRNLFKGKRLNIFSPVTDDDGVDSAVARPTLWDMDFANQLSMSVNQTPRNGLEEMIQWTKEGKMWQYPINNEAGLEEEASVHFHEHIFLDEHLKEGFPRQGPVLHFMELVVAGLSKNPYLTVQQKKEHISWFRDYFHQKEDVLKEADVFLN